MVSSSGSGALYAITRLDARTEEPATSLDHSAGSIDPTREQRRQGVRDRRTDRGVAKEVDAADLWDKVAYAAWACADPGLQYDTTINEWHTCPVDGRINASNPCSEYMFLDDTACNLASINLAQFQDEDGTFDMEGYKHAIRLWTIVLEISVLMASFPSQTIAKQSYEFRDTTAALTQSGTVSFLRPDGMTPYEVNGVEGNWVRARIDVGDFGKAGGYKVVDGNWVWVDDHPLAPPAFRSIEACARFLPEERLVREAIREALIPWALGEADPLSAIPHLEREPV